MFRKFLLHERAPKCFDVYNLRKKKCTSKWNLLSPVMDVFKSYLYMTVTLIPFLAILCNSILTHLFPMDPFSTPWKHQKTIRFSVCRGYREGALGTNRSNNRNILKQSLTGSNVPCLNFPFGVYITWKYLNAKIMPKYCLL